MRVRIDEAGRDHEVARVDRLGGGAGNPADLDDLAAGDGDVGAPRRGPCAVHHRAVPDEQVVGHPASSLAVGRRRDERGGASMATA
jgi:hypothetical protein